MVIMEKFSTQKTASEVMIEALTLQFEGADILKFLPRVAKVDNGAILGENVEFELHWDVLKTD